MNSYMGRYLSSKDKANNNYKNYPPEVVLKRVLKYAWKSKIIIFLSLIFLVAFTYLELLQP